MKFVVEIELENQIIDPLDDQAQRLRNGARVRQVLQMVAEDIPMHLGEVWIGKVRPVREQNARQRVLAKWKVVDRDIR